MPPHARFCSECGTWVVHGGPAQRMPPPPPVAMPEDPYAGTLPASALEHMSMLGAQTKRSDPPPHLDRTLPTSAPNMTVERMPSQMPPPKPLGARTEVRTVDTGRPPPLKTLDDQSSLSKTAKTGSKTIIDDAPPVTMSRSTVRTPRPLAAFLVSFQYEPLGTYWPLGAGSNLVGRSAGGRPDLDVGIGDTTVSSEQAVVEIDSLRPGVLAATVEDRTSRNGTAVNGRAIAAGVRVPVGHGDRIRFGSFETVLVLVPYPPGS
ncbi:MAG: FHA domain-containing protein [Polyangiales bacterium]